MVYNGCLGSLNLYRGLSILQFSGSEGVSRHFFSYFTSNEVLERSGSYWEKVYGGRRVRFTAIVAL